MADENPNTSSTLFSFPECVDNNGSTAIYLDDDEHDIKPGVVYVGVRYLELNPISKPAIVYEKSFLNNLSKIAFDFSMAHECYHLKSGDAFRAYEHWILHGNRQSRSELEQIENDADCFAATSMVTTFGYSLEELERAVLNRDDFATSGSVRRRAEHIMQCAEAALTQ